MLRTLKFEYQIISRYPANIMKSGGDEEYCAFIAGIFGHLGGSYTRNLRYEIDKFGGHLPVDDCAVVCVRVLRFQMDLKDS